MGRPGQQKRKKLRIFAAACCAAVFLVSGGMVARYWHAARQTQQGVERLKTVVEQAAQAGRGAEQRGPSDRSAGFRQLQKQNPDFIGWICVEGTGVDYPVMQSSDRQPEYYLRKNFQGEYDVNGLPFLDARCALDPASDMLLVYGHNMYSGVMFHDLLGYRKQAFWEEHPFIQMDTLTQRGTYQVAAAFLYDASSDETAFKPHRYVDFPDQAAFDGFVSQVRAAAYYDTGVALEYGDRLLMLATCDRTALQAGRLILVARLVESQPWPEAGEGGGDAGASPVEQEK